MIDLSSEDLEDVKKILKLYVPEYKVVVFGSRAKQTAKRRSDLDLCVIGDQPLSLNDIATLEDAFSFSDLGMKVDVVDWARVQGNFRNIIQESAVVIQEPEKIVSDTKNKTGH